MKNGDSTVHIYGTDYQTRDGTGIRDYIHVTDLAKAHVLALKHLEKTQESITLNLGTGTGFSVLEVVTQAEKVTGKTITKIATERREGNLPMAVADPSKAREILGFIAENSDLETIIESEWQALQD